MRSNDWRKLARTHTGLELWAGRERPEIGGGYIWQLEDGHGQLYVCGQSFAPSDHALVQEVANKTNKVFTYIAEEAQS